MEAGSSWPVSRQGKGVAGRAFWHQEGTRGGTKGIDFGTSRSNRTGEGKGRGLAFADHLLCAWPFAMYFM